MNETYDYMAHVMTPCHCLSLTLDGEDERDLMGVLFVGFTCVQNEGEGLAATHHQARLLPLHHIILVGAVGCSVLLHPQPPLRHRQNPYNKKSGGK